MQRELSHSRRAEPACLPGPSCVNPENENDRLPPGQPLGISGRPSCCADSSLPWARLLHFFNLPIQRGGRPTLRAGPVPRVTRIYGLGWWGPSAGSHHLRGKHLPLPPKKALRWQTAKRPVKRIPKPTLHGRMEMCTAPGPFRRAQLFTSFLGKEEERTTW